jgi:hypothetical protein
MAARRFGDEFNEQLARKAIMWGPAIAGGLFLGPAGIVLGLLTSASVVASDSNGNSSPRDGDDRSK